MVWGAGKGRFVRCLAVESTPHALAIGHTGSGLLVFTADDAVDGCVLHLFSINGRPLCRTRLGAPLSRMCCTRDGTMVVASEGGVISLRRLQPDLALLHRFEVVGGDGGGGSGSGRGGGGGSRSNATRVTAFSMSDENHHAFAADDDGCLHIYANPLVNIQVLERLAGELLNL